MIDFCLRWFFVKKHFATILLVSFLTQIVFIEGHGISYFKVGLMALCPVLLLSYRFHVTRAFVCCSAYFIYVFTTASFHPETFRASTIIYLGMFLMMYTMFYTYINMGTFSLDYFLKIVKNLIYAYCVCLICQQLCMCVGIRYMPLFNLNNEFYLEIFKLPSLSLEPSHSARILAVLYYAYLKCSEYKSGAVMTIADIFNESHKKVTLAFLWTMLTMGSGTAFIALGILSLYFLRGRQLIFSIPIFLAVFFIMDMIEVRQAKRAQAVVIATASLNSKAVIEADGSAAVRIKPLLNTLTIDLTKAENWFGRGCDAYTGSGIFSDERYIGGISNFGLIAYIINLMLLYSCTYRFFSLAPLLLYSGITGGISNVAYIWGMMMVFTCIGYFKKENDKDVSNERKIVKN